jgi:membrane-bound metal-dependent hydrolase YbcI (DUF457 family)
VPEIASRLPNRVARLAVGLVGFVLALDLLWRVVASTTAPTEFAVVDEPAHLATGLLFLLALVTLMRSRRPAPSFISAAVVASVAIDLDHVPGLLGWHGLTEGAPRPYTHSLVTPLALIVVGLMARGRARPIAFGAAFGVCAHLVRDLCTGPGVALLWPLSSAAVRLPYVVFALVLVWTAGVIAVAAARPGRSPSSGRTKWPEAPSISRLLPGVLAAAVLGIALSSFAPAGAAAAPTAFGVYVPGADQRPSRIESFAHQVGRAPVIASSYKRWRLQPFIGAELRHVWNRGAVPLVTWEPWTVEGRGFSLRAIAGGRYDAYVRGAANSAARWGRPILLRFAHEMNGTWYPWGRGRNGNTPRVYKAAWRHLVRIFRSAGADNVKWVWTPNVEGGGQYPFARFYPGNKWVNWVGLDGFNWARRGEWQSFTDIFGASYARLSRLSPRPMIIAETGSSQSGGDKAAWVSSALRKEIPRFSRVRAVVWFSDRVGDVDFRVNSSAASLQAFRSGISAPAYGLTRGGFLATPVSVHRSAAAPAPPSGGFGQPSLFYRLTQKLHGRYLWMAVAVFAAFLVVVALTVAWARRSRRRRRNPPIAASRRQAGGSEP